MDPLVSVVITNYNYSKYVGECIDSCMIQTYCPLEIVVVDDCSTDNSIDEISKYKVNLIRHEKNLGYSAAKNTGIRASRGQFIALLDADDKLTENSVQLRAEKLINDPFLDMCHGIALRWYGGNDTRGYNKKTYVHAQGRMYNRNVYTKYGLYYEPLRSMADKEMVYRLGVHQNSPLKRKIRDKRIKEVVALYRKHETQMHRVRKKDEKKNSKIKKMFNNRIKDLQKHGITRKNTVFL